MKAEDKLREALYFFSKIKELPDSVNKREELSFNLSAFVQAWRSVFDVLLYDYAEKCFKYAPERTFKITKESFEKIAEVLENLGNPEPMRFIKWYKEKGNILAKEHFWYLRILYFHRGGKILKPSLKTKYVLKKPVPYEPSIISKEPPYAVYFGENIQVETKEESAIAGMPQTVIQWECERVYLLMKEIVEEAREIFK